MDASITMNTELPINFKELSSEQLLALLLVAGYAASDGSCIESAVLDCVVEHLFSPFFGKSFDSWVAVSHLPELTCYCLLAQGAIAEFLSRQKGENL
jgi:hypothetical protein